MEIKKEDYKMYVPENSTGPLDVIIYYPGAGGSYGEGYDAKAMDEYIAQNPDKIVVVKYGCGDSGTDDIYEELNDLQKKGTEIDKVNIFGHSAGSNSAVDSAKIGAGYGYNINSVVSLDSAFNAAEYANKGSQAQVIAQNETKLIMFDQGTGAIDYGHLNRFVESGAEIVYIYCESSSDWGTNHATINRETVRDGIIDFICGDTDALKDSSHFKYHYMTYDYDKKQWVELTKAQAEEMMQKGILSNLEYVSEKMSTINSMMNATLKDNLKLSLVSDSTTKSPQINIDIYNKLCNGITTLCDKLYRETIAIVNAATLYEELDDKLKANINYGVLSDNVLLGKKFANPSPLSLYNSGSVISSMPIGKVLKELPEEGWNSYTYLLREKDITHSMYEVNADDLNRLFQHWADERNVKDSPLIGKGEYFIKAADAYGLDVMTLVAICAKETGYGCAESAYPRMKNHNFFGQDYTYDKNGNDQYWGSTGKLYDTDEEGIMAGARRIKEFYYDEKGFKTFYNIGCGGYAEGGGEAYGGSLANIYEESMGYILDTDPLNPTNEGKNLPTRPATTTTSSTTGSSGGSGSYSSSSGYDGSYGTPIQPTYVAPVVATSVAGATTNTGTKTDNPISEASSGTNTIVQNDEKITSTTETNDDKTKPIQTSNKDEKEVEKTTNKDEKENVKDEKNKNDVKETVNTETEKSNDKVEATTNNESHSNTSNNYTSNNYTSTSSNTHKEEVIEAIEQNDDKDLSGNNIDKSKDNNSSIKPITNTNDNNKKDNSNKSSSAKVEETKQQEEKTISNATTKKNNTAKNILTALGVTAAVGGATGAAIYGINEMKKNNEIEDNSSEDDSEEEDLYSRLDENDDGLNM